MKSFLSKKPQAFSKMANEISPDLETEIKTRKRKSGANKFQFEKQKEKNIQTIFFCS